MPMADIFKKDSSLILGEDKLDEKIDTVYEDNEILFITSRVRSHQKACYFAICPKFFLAII